MGEHQAPSRVPKAGSEQPDSQGVASSLTDQELLCELRFLSHTIATTRLELLQLDAKHSVDISGATDELDAVVQHTGSATNIILEVCEMLELECSAGASISAATIQAGTTRIFEACSFQDITGQRISKVVSTLKVIETSVTKILGLRGASMADGQSPGSVSLLNGPQLHGHAMEQSAVDAMLTDF